MDHRPVIVFLGAGSTIFAKNVLGDCFCRPSVQSADIRLYDIDAERLAESEKMLRTLNRNINENRAEIHSFLGVANRKKALARADFVINAIQVGGYRPSTVIDFEIPAKYGLKQTIGDTLGIGGIFRALRTIPVMLDIARDMEEVCPAAWLLNYTNPMAILTGAMLRGTPIRTVGLCHSVQQVVSSLLDTLDLYHGEEERRNIFSYTAGINHMAWLLAIRRNGRDLYPEIKAVAAEKLARWRREQEKEKKSENMIRIEMMLRFGYYVTESSEHNAEYLPYWIKNSHPELLEEYRIPIGEYLKRCEWQISEWKKQYRQICENADLTHELSHEYASGIIEAILMDKPYRIGGNILNCGLISNLPDNAVVEVPCLVDANGIQGCRVGEFPSVCAALNRTNINVQLLTVEAALSRRRELIYQAAMLDPHTAAELTLDQIVAMCDDLIEAHGSMLPAYH